MIVASLPLVAMAGTANALVSIFIAGRLMLAYREHPQEALRSFMLFYLFFGIFFLLAFGAQLFFLQEQYSIELGMLNVFAYFFLNMSIGFLLGFPFHVMGRAHLARLILVGALVYSVAFTVARIFYFSPSIYQQLAEYTYWQPVFPDALRMLTGLFAISTAAFVSVFFVHHGLAHKADRFVMYRSLWFASGIGVLLLAATVAFVLSPRFNAPSMLAATCIVLWGLVLMTRGILYTPPESVDM